MGSVRTITVRPLQQYKRLQLILSDHVNNIIIEDGIHVSMAKIIIYDQSKEAIANLDIYKILFLSSNIHYYKSF